MIGILLWLPFFIASIYDLQFQNIDGATQYMSQYQGKKILFVNIATGSERVGQLASLQQLQQQYLDSVTVIGFPSNSFGHEPRTDSEIKLFCQTQYGVSFQLASKASVTGADIQPIYNWLTLLANNGVMDQAVGNDFQKYLVDRNGNLVGVFSGKLDPLSPQLVNAIMR